MSKDFGNDADRKLGPPMAIIRNGSRFFLKETRSHSYAYAYAGYGNYA